MGRRCDCRSGEGSEVTASWHLTKCAGKEQEVTFN
jgi:hypothetical protein